MGLDIGGFEGGFIIGLKQGYFLLIACASNFVCCVVVGHLRIGIQQFDAFDVAPGCFYFVEIFSFGGFAKYFELGKAVLEG